MGLFDKKYCDFCGEKIGLFGNNKYAEGNMCDKCHGKLSPYFKGTRNATAADLRTQMDYREANRSELANFRIADTYGQGTKVLIDDTGSRFVVTSNTNLSEANPDIINISDVTGCMVDVEESSTEETRRDNEGHYVSYNPPRYTYSYDFYIIINVNNPYFGEIKFKVNPSTVYIKVSGGRGPVASSNPEYAKYQKLANDIKNALSNARREDRKVQQAAAAPKQAVICPCCGATTIPTANWCCEYCDGALK